MIFTICVPKEDKNTIYVDYQAVRLYMPKTKIVEDGEIVWKYSTKNWGMAFFSYRLSFQVYWNEMMTNGIKKKKATASIFCQQLSFLLYMENLISSKMKNIAY